MKRLDEHTRAFLLSVGIDPEDFLRELDGRAEDRQRGSGRLTRLIEEMMHEEMGEGHAEEMPSLSSPLDTDKLAQRIAAMIKSDMLKSGKPN